MQKKALAVISFGTTYPSARGAIDQIEDALHREFPEYQLYRAFTSKMVIRRIFEREGTHIDTPEELLEKLACEGYDEVVCQPLHVINGEEFGKLQSALIPYEGKFGSLRLGQPLLTAQEDYEFCVHSLLESLPCPREDEALVLMGHGTGHFSNAAYCQLENTFRYEGHENIYVGTVEGFPTLDYVIRRLERKSIGKIFLTPFMVVAGDHAQNDLAGEEENSWKTILEAKGYQVIPILKGLGEYPQIASLYLRHCKNASEVAGS